MNVLKKIIGIFILGIIYPQIQAIQLNKSNILKGSIATVIVSAAYFFHKLISDDSGKNASYFNNIVDCNVPKPDEISPYPTQSCFSNYENDPLVIHFRFQQARRAYAK